jgi:hypothetical protein
MVDDLSIAVWSAPIMRVRIGHELLAADKPMTAKELGDSLRGDQSNIKKEADRMASLGLIKCVAGPSGRAVPGRPPKVAFILTAAQRERAARELPDVNPPDSNAIGLLKRGQEIVVASADRDHLQDLLHVLVQAQGAAQAAWVAVCGDELLLIFDGPDPAEPALDLLAVLDGARVPSRRATVARVRPTRDLIRHARKTVDEAQRTRIRRDTRHVGS